MQSLLVNVHMGKVVKHRAIGRCSHAEGDFTNTNGHIGAHIMGRFGEASADFSWFLANSTSSSNKSIAARILNNGNACFSQVR